jgi:hypothetical protein
MVCSLNILPSIKTAVLSLTPESDRDREQIESLRKTVRSDINFRECENELFSPQGEKNLFANFMIKL